jgi:Asp/Glu/hydantoin racemase
MKLALINPNTSVQTTRTMVAIASEAVPADVTIIGMTAPWGVGLITNAQALAVAAQAVASLWEQLGDVDAVIVSAFGDPGLEELRVRLSVPVTGIAEAGMAEAATNGRRFAVVTTTPDLAEAIAAKAVGEGHSNFAGTWVTPGDPSLTTSKPETLESALHRACLAAIEEGEAEAIVIGGGPLALAARRLVDRIEVPIIEPVPAAARLAYVRALKETVR